MFSARSGAGAGRDPDAPVGRASSEPTPLALPGSPWKSLAIRMEDGAGGSKDEALRAAHTPVVHVLSGGQVHVRMQAPHPMQPEHWITVLYVRDQHGALIALRDFGQASLLPELVGGAPDLRFTLPPGTTCLTAYAHCHLHAHFSSALVIL
jgi:desulfoferrodoxin (superoxide reductase-like protein)